MHKCSSHSWLFWRVRTVRLIYKVRRVLVHPACYTSRVSHLLIRLLHKSTLSRSAQHVSVIT